MEQTKSFNTRGGKNRLRFTSSKSRAKRASADIYRANIGEHLSSTSSTAVREKRVHDGSSGDGGGKKRRKNKNLKSSAEEDTTVRFFERDNDVEGFGIGRTAVIVTSASRQDDKDTSNPAEHDDSRGGIDDEDEEKDASQLLLTGGTEFLIEIEISAQRNGSQLFQKLVWELRPLCKSFAELLYHKKTIVELLCKNLLSDDIHTGGFIANVATNDVLHLLGVLARELRVEIYPFLNTKILPRIIDDMLNPPQLTGVGESSERQHHRTQLDVAHIEAAFRCISYLFKYNSEELVNSKDASFSEDTKQKQQQSKHGDADILRQYYGRTICHKRDDVRKLACEAFAPLLRKCTEKGLQRHLMRTVKALATSSANAKTSDENVNHDTDGSNIKVTKIMKRALNDAVDGVSFLLFEVARGAKRAHSRTAHLVIRSLMDCLIGYSSMNAQKCNDTKNIYLEMNKAEVVYEVASLFLYKLRGHVVRGTPMEETIIDSALLRVFDEIHRALDAAVSLMKEAVPSFGIHASVVGHIVDLIAEMVSFQGGRLIRGTDTKPTESDRIVNSLQTLLSNDVYSKAGKKLETQILNYLSVAWKVNPNHPSFTLRLGKFFPRIVSPNVSDDEDKLRPAIFLATKMLPYLPQKVASQSLIPSLLSAASLCIGKEGNLSDDSLVLLHTISSATWSVNESQEYDVDADDAAADSFFSVESALQLPVIPSKVRRSLIDLCLRDDLKDSKSTCSSSWMERLARVGYAVRCLPFLVCLECSGDGSDEDAEDTVVTSYDELKKVLKWFVSIMKHLDTGLKKNSYGNYESLHVVQALVIESFSKVAIECHNREQSAKIQSALQKTATKIKSSADSLLSMQPKSCWVVKCVAALLTSLNVLEPGSTLNERSNETFELLVPNLSEANHFLRLYTLQILDSYPKRPFVTDHAELDLTDDLEEEPSYKPGGVNVGEEQTKGMSELAGPCDIISLLKTIEAIPVAFANERKLTSQIGRVEVYAATGKLPVLYAESAVSHMLGLLHVKFSPIWPAAVRVIVALTTAQEGPTWPHVYSALQKSMEKSPPDFDSSVFVMNLTVVKHDQNDSVHTKTLVDHHNRCVAWERSNGSNHMFGSQDRVEGQVVPRNSRADDLTLFGNLWNIMTSAQHLTTTKSKLVVPLFFEFMAYQYYVFHPDDPDIPEVNLSDIVDSRCTWSRHELGRKSVQTKFECFLRMFAAVKGPQQLFKHHLLMQMFTGFLSNPDTKVANLALLCLQKYKLSYLVPYVDSLKQMLKKDELRDALAKFDLSVDSDSVDAEHRLSLIPIVTRILFGRLASRGSGSKSSRDSPAARRAAILAFFSRMGNINGELTYFVYMMVRAFIPPGKISSQLDSQIILLGKSIESLNSIVSRDVRSVPTQRQIGFLNLLSDVISQIGFGVDHVVPVFMNLLLRMCEEAQDALVASTEHPSPKTEEGHDEESSTRNDKNSQIGNENSQIGRIRTLAFLRIGELLTKFASAVDFSAFGNRLWKATSCSLRALPNTVINAENPPSLLRLIESISAHAKLLTLFDQSKDVIPAVFKCIAGTTRLKVMNCVLRVIDNLLTGGGTVAESSRVIDQKCIGQTLILEHIHLLITQFNERFMSKIAKCDNGDGTDEYSDRGQSFRTTEGVQLDILCRVSELLLADSSTNDDHIKTMDNLCELLVPSLKFDTHPNQLHLLRIVANFIPRVPAESAKSHYHALSKLLGPKKSDAGISSHEMRQIITTALDAIGKRSPTLRKVTEATRDLNAFSTSHVDEHDFKRMLPVLNSLGSSATAKGSWLDLSTLKDGNSGEPRVLFPLMYSCLHMLYNPDAVVARASNKALKSLITICFEQVNDLTANPWIQFVEKTVVPCLKIGLMTKTDDARRYFILLISHVARNSSDFKSPHLYGDLSSLIRDDDQDLDFFLNVTHLQLHRRVKALQRLRKMISTTDAIPLFSEQSYGNVLLPIAIHPVYEYKSKSEDLFVVEAIATVKVLSKHLPWGKYSGALQSVLNSLTRQPEKERYLISLLCAMIDAFHFSVEADANGLEAKLSATIEGNGVWRSLKNRIIPKVEAFLVKEKTDKSGTKTESIRASVVLALVKLFQKLPTHTFEEKLPRLIKVVSNALRNRDSKERDIARETMAKIAISLDMKYLPLILSDISVSLSCGYQLHVRAATLHSILMAISGVYRPQTVNSIDEALGASFDRCVPAMLDLIQQDIFGTSSEMKEVEHVEKRMIKEAMGSKSQDSLEIISRLIVFKPSMATSVENRNKSTAHILVSPFIERLLDSEVLASSVRKVNECLNRIAFGLSNNPSASIHEVLPFIYATISPFVLGETRKPSDVDAELENSDDEVETPLEVSKSSGTPKGNHQKKKAKGAVVAVSSWAPSTLGSAENQRSAFDTKRHQQRDLHKVRDGITAPKLTGSLHHNPVKMSPARSLNNPAHASALMFGLSMLNSCLKRSKLDPSDEMTLTMADPYLHLLLEYVRCSRDNNGVVLSLRCLGLLLRAHLPSVPAIAKELSPIILDHLTQWGAATNTQTEIVQGCFKTLTLLFLHPNLSLPENRTSTDESCSLPLAAHQMQALISLLQSAVMESEHHNATFGLVKAICSVKYISSEFYDLMEIILKLSVQSQKSSVRMQSSQIFLQFLLDYPMGTQRLENHLQQIVLNLKYEYEEGRLSAIDLLSSVIQKLPVPVLESHSQLFFLPLVLQLANDNSKKCKEAVTNAMSLLLTRMSTEIIESFFNYVNLWSQSSGKDSFPMRQAASQLFGIFIESRPDYIKRGPTSTAILSAISNAVQSYIPFGDDSGWELLYYNLVCTEKLNKEMWSSILTNNEIGLSLVKLMAYPHPWIMQVSLRIINNHLSRIDPKLLLEQGADSYIVKSPSCLYDIARNLCCQLDVDDTHYVETLSILAIKSVTWVFQAMNHHPHLFYANTTGCNQTDESEQLKSPCRWIMSRLSNIAKPKLGVKRRESIFKCYAALCASCKPEMLTPYLRLMIDSLDRAIREETNNLQSDEQQATHPRIALPKDVLNLLEEVCGTEKFLEAYSEVNNQVRQKRDQRKQDIAAEAVHDPASAAKRKIKKQLHEKERKKRRVSDIRAMRGASKKKLRG